MTFGILALICALSRLSRPLPEYLFTEATKSDLQLSATYGNLNTGSATSTMLCQPLPSYAKFAKNGFSVFKSQIRRKNRKFTTLNADFTTLTTLTTQQVSRSDPMPDT